MQFVRSLAIAAACMAAFHVQASTGWSANYDGARRLTQLSWAQNSWSTLQGAVAYSMVTDGNKVTANRTLPVPISPSSPVLGRPPAPFSAYGTQIAVDIPTRVPVPGRTIDVPARVVDVIPRSSLNTAMAKSLKLLPVVGTALTIAEIARLLDEIDVTVNPQGEFVPSNTQIQCGSSSTYSEHRSYISSQFINQPGTYICGNQTVIITWNCFGSPIPSLPGFANYHHSTIPASSFPSMSCSSSISRRAWANHPYLQGNISNQTQTLSLTESQLANLLANASLQAFIDALNALPQADPRTIDVIAREIQDAPNPAPRLRLFPSPDLDTPQSVEIGEPHVETETHPDGSTTTHTRRTVATTTGTSISFTTERTTETKNPEGTTTSTTTTTTTVTDPRNPNSPEREDLECGLPGTPPCKIDEEGTPPPPEDDSESIFRLLVPNCLQSDWKTCFPELPDINWSFSLPSSCGSIPVPFGQYGFNSINICQWKPMIHDLMSMLWAAAGLFGAISILSGRRNSES